MTLKRLLAVAGTVTDWARRHVDRNIMHGGPTRWWRA